MYTISLI
jgi:large subunit ribosomal protein LP0